MTFVLEAGIMFLLFHSKHAGGFTLRKLNAAVDRFAYNHPRFGIPTLM